VAVQRRSPFPEVEVGGFTRLDGTVEFYSRIHSILVPDMVVLDVGAGRAAWLEDSSEYRRRLRLLRGTVRRVIGVDVDAAVLGNQAVDEALVMPDAATLPLADDSVDLAIADAVFEHVADPEAFVRELGRVVKPGGWVCARTPNRWGYPAVGARLLPNPLHAPILRYLQPRRRSEDVFPTHFLLNSRNQLQTWFRPDEWHRVVYAASGEPTYAGSSPVLLTVLTAAHGLLPPGLQTSLFIFLRRM